MIKLSDDKLTKLPRFLSPDPKTIAFGTIQKTFVSLDTEIKSLSIPVSADYFSVAGGIEDHATNAPLIIHRLCKSIRNLEYIFGMELMHAAQAVELRNERIGAIQLGRQTELEYLAFRRTVPFLQEDRALSDDIQRAFEFVHLMQIDDVPEEVNP